MKKVPTTDDEKAVREKERRVKMTAFSNARDRIFQKRSKGIQNSECYYDILNCCFFASVVSKLVIMGLFLAVSSLYFPWEFVDFSPLALCMHITTRVFRRTRC